MYFATRKYLIRVCFFCRDMTMAISKMNFLFSTIDFILTLKMKTFIFS